MSLPPYRQDISLEEALGQFDYAASQLVLHPLNGSTEDIEKRRVHILESATDANNASSRWIGVLERGYDKAKLSKDLVTRYLRDVDTCMMVLEKTIEWYSRIEIRESEYNPESQQIPLIRREKDIINSYIDLMGRRSGLVRKMLN